MNTNNMHVSVGGGDYTLKAAKLTNNEFHVKAIEESWSPILLFVVQDEQKKPFMRCIIFSLLNPPSIFSQLWSGRMRN